MRSVLMLALIFMSVAYGTLRANIAADERAHDVVVSTVVGMYSPTAATVEDVSQAADMVGGVTGECPAEVAEAIIESFGFNVYAQCVDTKSLGMLRDAIAQLAVFGLQDEGWFYVTPWMSENDGLTTFTHLGNTFRGEALTVAVYDSMMVIYYVQPVVPLDVPTTPLMI